MEEGFIGRLRNLAQYRAHRRIMVCDADGAQDLREIAVRDHAPLFGLVSENLGRLSLPRIPFSITETVRHSDHDNATESAFSTFVPCSITYG
jgi:hypothetical protein